MDNVDNIIYALKLKGGKYYIGKTTITKGCINQDELKNNINNNSFIQNKLPRIRSHFIGEGSWWTKKYKPEKTLEIRIDNSIVIEMQLTMEYMNKYGIDNVRGGPWCKINIAEIEKKFIQKCLRSNDDKCYNCGKKGHFIDQCPSIKSKNISEEPVKKNQEKFNTRLIEITETQNIEDALKDMCHLFTNSEDGTKKCLCGRKVKHKSYYQSTITKKIIIAGSGCKMKIENKTPNYIKDFQKTMFNTLKTHFNYEQNGEDNVFPSLDQYCRENVSDIIDYFINLVRNDNFKNMNDCIVEMYNFYSITGNTKFMELIDEIREKAKPKSKEEIINIDLLKDLRIKFAKNLRSLIKYLDKMKSRNYYNIDFVSNDSFKEVGGKWDKCLQKWYLESIVDDYAISFKFTRCRIIFNEDTEDFIKELNKEIIEEEKLHKEQSVLKSQLWLRSAAAILLTKYRFKEYSKKKNKRKEIDEGKKPKKIFNIGENIYEHIYNSPDGNDRKIYYCDEIPGKEFYDLTELKKTLCYRKRYM